MKFHCLILVSIFNFLLGCALDNKMQTFSGEIVSINSAPLEIDGDAEILINTPTMGKLKVFVTACAEPQGCNRESVDFLWSGKLAIGESVEVKARREAFPTGEKLLIEDAQCYIRPIAVIN